MKVCYIVLTCEKYIDTRYEWQKETMFRDVESNTIYYLGHKMDLDKRIYSWGANDNYSSLPYKFYDFFKNMNLDYDWYILIDDDTFVYHNRLIESLSKYDKNENIVEGYIVKHIESSEWGIYFSGGAGTVLSRPVYDSICKLLRNTSSEYRVPHWCADISLGMWLKTISNIEFKHNCFYCPDMYREGLHISKQMITFHHLKTREDYLLCNSFSN